MDYGEQRLLQGPVQEIDTTGPAVVVRDVRALNEELGETRVEVPEILAAMAEQEQRFFLGNGMSQSMGEWLRRATEAS